MKISDDVLALNPELADVLKPARRQEKTATTEVKPTTPFSPSGNRAYKSWLTGTQLDKWHCPGCGGALHATSRWQTVRVYCLCGYEWFGVMQ